MTEDNEWLVFWLLGIAFGAGVAMIFLGGTERTPKRYQGYTRKDWARLWDRAATRD